MEQGISTEVVGSNQHRERPTLIRVFYSVFVEFFTDIGKGVFGFFSRFIVLVWDCLKFIWRPDAEYHEIAKDKTLKNAKYTFQFIIIITSITVFLIKQNIVQSTDDLKEAYGNDVFQYIMEFIFFLAYVAIFFLVMILLVLLGRLLRQIFKPIETRDVTDKVFIHLNNIFFLFTIIFAFLQKLDSENQALLANDSETWAIHFAWFFGSPLLIIVFTFFIRLVMINHAKKTKAVVYGFVVPSIIYAFLWLCGFFIVALFSGI